MPELTPEERLQPSLLDRLTDDEPENPRESRERRVLSMRALRASVQRDLEWLLNADNLEPVHDLDDYPEVRASVVNYGLPPLSGLTASGVDARQLEKLLREVIRTFEPRILPETVRVRALVPEGGSQHNAIEFEIEGNLWAQPMPLQLFLRTEVDLESGSVHVAEVGGGRSR